MTHQRVALNDVRNRGVLELLRPERLTAAMVAERLIRAHRGRASGGSNHPGGPNHEPRRGADTPASQPLSAVADPFNRLGTHPDLIEHLWTLNSTLPEDCRWVVYGFPVLVAPIGVVIFAFARGTRGYALRLTGECRSEADSLGAKTRTDVPPNIALDVAEVGPEWRLG